MAEKPILFNGEMVRAILDGRKMQTIRPIKYLKPYTKSTSLAWIKEILPYGDRWEVWSYASRVGEIRCPYGRPGDRLYVRETWRVVGWHEGEPYYLEYKADGECMEEPGNSELYDEDKYFQYGIDCADDCLEAGLKLDDDEEFFVIPDGVDIPTRWRRSIHMPKWAARLWLTITDVSVMRIQQVTYDDYRGEGIEKQLDWVSIDMKHAFIGLWNSLYAAKGLGWDTNPWCWRIKFERVK